MTYITITPWPGKKNKSMQNYGCKEIMSETDLFYERSKIFAQFPKTLFA